MRIQFNRPRQIRIDLQAADRFIRAKDFERLVDERVRVLMGRGRAVAGCFVAPGQPGQPGNSAIHARNVMPRREFNDAKRGGAGEAPSPASVDGNVCIVSQHVNHCARQRIRWARFFVGD